MNECRDDKVGARGLFDAYVGHCCVPHPDSRSWQVVVMVSLHKLVLLPCPLSGSDRHFLTRGDRQSTRDSIKGALSKAAGAGNNPMELKDASLAESWGQVAHCRPALVDPPATAARKPLLLLLLLLFFLLRRCPRRGERRRW